jgi:hypothetical protein
VLQRNGLAGEVGGIDGGAESRLRVAGVFGPSLFHRAIAGLRVEWSRRQFHRYLRGERGLAFGGSAHGFTQPPLRRMATLTAQAVSGRRR